MVYINIKIDDDKSLTLNLKKENIKCYILNRDNSMSYDLKIIIDASDSDLHSLLKTLYTNKPKPPTIIISSKKITRIIEKYQRMLRIKHPIKKSDL